MHVFLLAFARKNKTRTAATNLRIFAYIHFEVGITEGELLDFFVGTNVGFFLNGASDGDKVFSKGAYKIMLYKFLLSYLSSGMLMVTTNSNTYTQTIIK